MHHQTKMKKQKYLPPLKSFTHAIAGSMPTNSRVLTGDAIDQFITSGSITLKPAAFRTIQNILRKLETVTGNIQISAVTTEHVSRIVFDPFMLNRTKQFHLVAIRRFLQWCRSQGYLPADHPTVADYLIVRTPAFVRQILTPDELRQLLAAATHVETRLGIAFHAFTGVRRLELQELSWENVTPGVHVHLTAQQTHGLQRVVPISPVLDAWLRPFYGTDGAVISSASLPQKIRLVAQGAGINLKPNVFRNSYGSYRLADTKDFSRTAMEMGYNADRSWNPFVDALTSQARQYFALTPEAVGITDWNLRVARHLMSRREKAGRKPPAPNQTMNSK
jgi:integrase